MKADLFQLCPRAFKARDSSVDDANVVAFHLVEHLLFAPWRPVSAKNDILAPKKKFDCEISSILIGTDDCQGLITMLPTVAIWAAMSRDAVKSAKAFDWGQFVHQPGR